MSREALHMSFGGPNALETFAALLLCERPDEPSAEAARLAHMAAGLARDRSRGRSGTVPFPVLIPEDLGPFRALYALAREQAKHARHAGSAHAAETKPALAMRLLLSLRHRQRAAVGLRYVIGMPAERVGLILGLNPRSTEEIIRAGLNAIARKSRSKIDVRRNLRTAAASLAWAGTQAQTPRDERRPQPRSVVRLLIAPSPFGLTEPDPGSGWDAPALERVVSKARPVYGSTPPGRPPPVPVRDKPAPPRWVGRLAVAAAAILVIAMFGALPHGGRVGPVPLAVLPLAPAISAPAAPAAAGPVTQVYLVRSGDTLWSIAAGALGDPFRWQEVWRANAGRRMGDGSRFVDPDLIRPGWRLALPPARSRAGG